MHIKFRFYVTFPNLFVDYVIYLFISTTYILSIYSFNYSLNFYYSLIELVVYTC